MVGKSLAFRRRDAVASIYGLPIPISTTAPPAKEEDHGKALATLSPGNLTLAHQTQNLASLNTDASKANTQVSPLDIEKLKAKQQSAAALSQLLNEGVGDLSVKLGFAEGSAEKTALHAAVGALVSQLAGGNAGTGAVAGALSELANGVLQDVLKANPNISEADKAAITQWVATAVGAAIGGQAGAAAVLDNVNHNYLTHEQSKTFGDKLASCKGDRQCEIAVGKQYQELSDAQNAELLEAISNGDTAVLVKAYASGNSADLYEAILKTLGPNSTAADTFYNVFWQGAEIKLDNGAREYATTLAFYSIRDNLAEKALNGKISSLGGLIALAKREFGVGVLTPNLMGIVGAVQSKITRPNETKVNSGEKSKPIETSNADGEKNDSRDSPKGGAPVGESYIPKSNSIVKDSTVRLDQNIVTASGDIIPAGSVVTESGGAFKIVTPNGVTVTGKTDNLVKPSQLALPNNASIIVNFDVKQLQKKFKHAADFGVQGSYNTANAKSYQQALEDHIRSQNTREIAGTYQGKPVTHYVDPITGLDVMKGPTGQFISGWKL